MHILFSKNTTWKKYLKTEVASEFSLNDSDIKDHGQLPVLEINSSLDLKNAYLGFALDVIPNAISLADDTIGVQASQIIDRINDQNIKKIHFQVFGVSSKYGIITTGRSDLLKQKISKSLRKEGITFSTLKDPAAGVLKVVVYPDRSLRLCIINNEVKANYLHLLSPFPGGYTTVKDDKDAPSRAFKKLIESQWVLDNKIEKDHTLLDLGACPGGWSYVALKQGASVIAIDRSPLREDLMPKINFQSTDAFKFQVDHTLDWVVSDIICEPKRIFELLDNWVKTEKCHNFVFTIKFKGDDDYPILQEFKTYIKDLPYQTILRQLNVNKNEVMVMGKK